MARYTGPRVRISRRFGIPIFGPSKYLERRNYGPGVHGPKGSRRKTTEYGLGLLEKQKLRYFYGLMERQFRGVYERAKQRRGITGEQMLQILETRLDNIVYHLGFGNTRSAARQFVGHGHIRVNGRKVSIPSFAVKVNDIVEVKDSPRPRQLATKNLEGATSRRARLAFAQQGHLQGCPDAYPDSGRDPSDCQHPGGRRILFPLNQRPSSCEDGHAIIRAAPHRGNNITGARSD